MLQQDVVDKSRLLSMQPTVCVESASLVLAETCNSAMSSAKLHQGLPGISSSRSTILGCKRSRQSVDDVDCVPEDGDEVDSASKPSNSNAVDG